MSHRREHMTVTEAIADTFVSGIVENVLPQVPEIEYWEIPADDRSYAAASFRFTFTDDSGIGKFEFETRRDYFGKKLEDLETKLSERGLPSLFNAEIWEISDEVADEGHYGVYATENGISVLANLPSTRDKEIAEFIGNAVIMAEETIAYAGEYLWDFRKEMDAAEEDDPGSSDRSEWEGKVARAEELIAKANTLLSQISDNKEED